ncbi:helix-turn-helix domain-containing protein [Hafnia paralvei]|uniref:helix-turn-helix domain-containing protein n=1 Tax=Hafnia paralvei TaxID=546367 RepID=UPI00300CF34D
MKKIQQAKRKDIFEVLHIDNVKSEEKILQFKNVILRIIPEDEMASCFFKTYHSGKEGMLNLLKPSIVRIENETTVVFKGQWRIEVADTDTLATLFSIIEMGSSGNASPSRDFILPNKFSPRMAGSTYKVLINNTTLPLQKILFFSKSESYRRQYNELYKTLRRRESYGLIKFLLTSVIKDSKEKKAIKIQDLCKEYGVSNSYFRRLCVKNLTCAAKVQINSWRGAYSVLDIIESSKDINSIAYHNGYASSSHFSSDIKSNFGLTPKQFRVIEGILYE